MLIIKRDRHDSGLFNEFKNNSVGKYRRYSPFLISSNSTSNIKALPGGISPAPRKP